MVQPQLNVAQEWNWRPLLIAILLLAVAVRLAYSLGLQRTVHHILPEQESTDGYHLIAVNWFTGNGYTFRAGDPPTMLRPPAYPAMMFAVFTVFGIHFVWVQVLQALLGALSCWLLFLLGRWVHSVELGLMAALLLAFYPNSVVYSARLYSETLYFPLFIGLCYLLCRASFEGSGWRGALAGVVWSLGLLTRGTLYLLPLALPLGIALSQVRRGVGHHLRWALPALVAALLTLSPWVIRNYALSGAFVPVSSWGWAPMYAGAQVSKHMGEWGADLTLVDNGAITELRALTRQKLGRADDQRSTGPQEELAEEKIAKAAVLGEWREQPGARASRAIAGLAFTWFLAFDVSSRVASLALHGVIFCLFFGGAILLARRHPDSFWRAWPALGMILFVNVFQAAAFPHVRYMSPAVAVALLFAAVPLLELVRRWLPPSVVASRRV